MSIEFTGRMNIPNYTCLTTDITAGVFSGTTISGQTPIAEPGLVIFVTDSEEWLIVRADGIFVPYSLPVEVTASIGAVGIDQPLDDSIEISPIAGSKSIGSAGHPEAIVGVATYCVSVFVSPKSDNVGSVYFGDADVKNDSVVHKEIVLAAGSAGLSIDAPLGYKLNLLDFYIDVDTNGDGINFIYFTD